MITPRSSAEQQFGRTPRRVFSAVFLVALAMFCMGAEPVTPLKVAVTPVPSRFDGFLQQTGNIRVVFSDGHSETWTENGNAILPKMSSRGDIGWVELDKTQVDVERKNRRGRDKVVIRLYNGIRREFVMRADIPFISNWEFAEEEAAISVEVSGYHGPRSYFEYDLGSGELKNEINGYVPPDALPAWARQVSAKNE